jgi:plasmid stabilization system protein ParE
MTVRVFASRRAKIETEAIAAYLEEEFSAAAAARFLEALARAHQLLSEHPEVGPAGARAGTRRLIVGNYIVSYRRQPNEVEIFAVRHARRRDARF